ncbi:MAG: glycoside hydrolase family 9 [Ktedonobacterales bacterium]|nr:MAG: glycoside hydrolase family 9 [Ktedonobacterales bacterium]
MNPRIPFLSRRRIVPFLTGILITCVVTSGVWTMSLGSARVNASGTAYIRINQLGYATTATKRGYLMVSGSEAGATFSVKNTGGAIVASGTIGASLGSWSSSYPDVYGLDFDTVTSAGTYTIAVSGAIPATSPGFQIDTAANLYAIALSNALSFYQTERDGPNYIPSALRTAPRHLNDASAMTYLTPSMNNNGRFSGDLSPLGIRIDASGGWWDAGDYLKFVETTSYTVAMLQLGVRDFPTQLGAGSASANFTAEAKFGLTFLQHMWDDATQTLYYQVGIGNGNSNTISDHDIWRLPQADDTFGGANSLYRYIRNRPVFRAATPGSLISPNLAGRLAADFALGFQLYKTSDPTFANTCLLYAEHIFGLANTSPSGNLLTTAPFSFYPETEWRDDLELGATELYFALTNGGLPGGLPQTGPAFYLQSAAHWAHAYITGPIHAADSLNLYDVSGSAHYELYRAIAQAGNPTGLEASQADLLGDLKKQLDKAVTQSGADPFGFTWAAVDTTTYGTGQVVMEGEYDHLTGTTAYASYGVRRLANILGANSWGISLIVGDGAVFPHCMQHQVANLA